MSPTSFVPGVSAQKSPPSRSGAGGLSPATVVTERPGLARDQAELAHDRADQLRAASLALTGQRGVDAPVPVGLVGVVEDPLDEDGEPFAPPLGCRGGALAPLVAAGRGHTQPRAHSDDWVLHLLRVDELVLGGHRYSWAKKAAAFPRNSAFIFSSRFSRSSSRSRARSDIDSGRSSSACSTRYLFTQFPMVPSLTWISRATSAIARDDSITIFAASPLNSGLNLRRRSRNDQPPFRTGPYWVRCPGHRT